MLGWRNNQTQLDSKQQQTTTGDKEADQFPELGPKFSMNSAGPMIHAKKRERMD